MSHKQSRNARQQILDNLAARLGQREFTAYAGDTVAPVFSDDTFANKDALEQFSDKLQRVHGTIHCIERWEQLGAAVQRYLTELDLLSADLYICDALRKHYDIDNDSGLGEIPITTQLSESAISSLTLAHAGVAETGTVAMASGDDSPVLANFLPQNHIIVLPKARIVATLEDLWSRYINEYHTFNLITGPSKTGDIEQTIVYGAHGPRRTHVIVITA